MDTYIVTRDGRTLATFTTEADAWRCLHRQQSGSIYHATKHGGFDIIYPNGEKLSETYGKGTGK